MKKILLTLYIAILFVPFQAFAAQPTNLSISPILVYPKIDPGKSHNEALSISNRDKEPIALKVYAQNFLAADQLGGISFNTDENSQYSAMDWITFDRQNLVIDPQKTEKMTIKIQVPKDAEPGDHYAVVFFEPLFGQDYNDNSQVGVSGRVGALFMITVNGEVLEKGRVLGTKTGDKCIGVGCSFKTDKFREWGPVPFEFKFENTGNIHTRVTGKIDIFNILGMKVGEVPINEQTVLAKQTRNFTAKWLREPLFGWYRAKLTLTYGSLKVNEKAEADFWAIPWKILLLFVPALITGYLIWRKRRKKHKLNKIGVQNEKK